MSQASGTHPADNPASRQSFAKKVLFQKWLSFLLDKNVIWAAPGKTGYGGNLSTGGMEAGEAGIQFLTLG